MRLLFEGGYYSGCGYYSSKYGIQYLQVHSYISKEVYYVYGHIKHEKTIVLGIFKEIIFSELKSVCITAYHIMYST